tara:strand:- start:1177 stop:1395 length:219 start_codon:yes stop_codon:yes gene_type:complete
VRVLISADLDYLSITLNAESSIERLTTHQFHVPPSTRRDLRLVRRKEPFRLAQSLQPHIIEALVQNNRVLLG